MSDQIPEAFGGTTTPSISTSALDALENVLTLDEIINGARLPERVIRIFKRGDLIGELDDVEGRLEELVDEDGQPYAEDLSLGEQSEVQSLTSRSRAIRAELAKDSFPFRVRAMGSAKWKPFFAKWEDRNAPGGVKDGFWDALLIESAISPPLPDQAAVTRFRDAFNHSQTLAVGQAAFSANVASGLDIPKLPDSLAALKHEERS